MPLQNQNQTTAKERALARAKANALAEQRAAEQRQVGTKMSLPAAASGGKKRTGLAADSSWSEERKTAAQKANREAVKSLPYVAKKDVQSRFGGLKNDAETQRQIALENKMGTGGSWEDTRTSRAIKSGLSGTAAGLTNAVGTVMGSLESDKNYGLAVDSGKIPKKATGEEWNNRLGRKLRPAVESVQGLADKMQARSEKEYEEGTKGLNTAQRMLFDAGVAGTQMLGDMAIGALTGGNTLVPMAARVFGQGAQEARQAGATRDQQLLYGALSAGVETFTEKMFDGLNLVYGKGATDRIVENVAKKLASGETGQSVVKALIGSAGEGLEEVVSGLLSPALEAIYNGKSPGENYSELEAAELLYEGAVGALLGGVGGAANVAETARNMRGQRRVEEPKSLKTAGGQQDAQEEPKYLKRAEEQTAQKPVQEEPRYLKTAEEMAAEPTLEELMAGGRATQEQQETFIRKYGEEAFNRLVIENMQNGRIDGEGNDLVWKAEEPRYLQTAEEPARQTAQELRTEEPRYLRTAEGQTAQEMQEPRHLKTAEEMSLEEPGVHGDTAWMSREDADYLSQLAKAARASIEVVDTLGDAQGTYDPKTGRIRIAKDATDPVGFVTQHELTHRIRDNAPQQWGQFLEYVQKHYGEDWNSVLEGYQRRYAEHDIELTAEEAAEEAAADFAGRMNESDIRRLTQENRSLAQRILDTIRDLIRKLKGGESQKLYEMEKLWAGALKEGKKNTATEGGARYSYAGENAKTADLNALERAKEMKKQGVAAETIRQETGWFTGADGKWRYEIDDSRAEYRGNGDAQLMKEPGYQRLQELTQKWADSYEKGGEALTKAEEAEMEALQEEYSDAVWEEKYLLRDFLHHEELFRAYPYLNRVNLDFDDLPSGVKGRFDRRTNTITLSNDLIGTTENTLLHEIQHVIQKVEGFSGGSSIDYWNRKMEDGYSKKWDSGEEMMPSELYRNSAGEIEARDTANRRKLTAEERRVKAPDTGNENTVFADGAESGASIEKTTENKPFVEIERDILAGVPETDWVSAVKSNLAKKFPNGVAVGNNEIRIDGQSRREMTFSKYMKWLYNNDPQLRKDKLRATDNADEILHAATGWVSEGLKHTRKDKITDFARGNVLLRVGKNDYAADVVVGTRANGDMLLYDVLNLKKTSFTKKETDTAITANPSPGADRSTVSLSDTSIRSSAENGNTQNAETETKKKSLKGSKEAAEEIEREAGRKRRLQAAEGGEIKPGAETRKAFNDVRKARRAAERAERVNRLTDAEKETVDKLLKGELSESSDEVNQHVLAAYRAKKVYEDYAGEIREYRKEHRGALREKADQALGDLTAWKDKKAGLLYSRETMERNIRDIAPDKETAKRIVEKYFTPVHEGEAKATRMKNEYRDRVRKLSLSRKVAKGNKVSEAAAVQILGEAESAIQSLENAKEGARRDGKTLKEWRGIVEDLWRENPALDQGKIGGAVEEFRGLYDELIQQINEVRVRNGYEPVEYRKGYFPHFKNGEADGALKALGKALGIETEVTQLPTSINGLTHTFKPGIRWFGNALERTGYDTVYDAVEGFDRYIEGAAGVVTQTDNIQNLRALANQIRWRSTDEGIRAEMERIQGNDALDEGQKQELLQRLFDNGRYALSNFVAELDEYTNLLANKKSRGDRSMEAKLGRNAYTLMKNLEGRVAANMVAVNPASWLTNFVPLTQGFASVDAGSMFRGMWDTMRAYKEDDGFAGKSSFLTNRRGSDPLVKTWSQNASAKLSKPMEYIDTFTADSLVRARYLQNKEGGLSDAEAMREADAWAAGVMADRSKGATPTIFSEKNPIAKLFTQFQLEVNNQLSWLLKDLPDDKKEKGAAAIAAALLKFFVGSFLYNELYEYVIGRRPALDPLGMLNDAVGDLAGRELPNLTDAAVKTARGEEFKLKQSEPQGIYGAATGLAESVAENLPFVGGILGGGRIPISSALPDFENLAKAIAYDGWSDEKRAATLAKELSAPATYLALPFGGGQLKRIYQSIKAVKEGGSYSMDKDGNPLLQYPVYNDTEKQRAGALTKSMIFGKSSLKPAQDWVESGFDSFNAKETATYQGMNDAGVSDEDAYALIREMGNAKKTKTMSATTWKRRILQNADISEAGKSVAYYGLLANDKEQELMDELEGSENMGAVTEVLMELKDADLLSGKQANNKRMTALMDNRLSNRGKLKIYQEMISDDTEDLEDALSVGVSFDDFLQFKETVYGLASDETETKKEKVMDAIDNMDLTKEQKDELYFIAGYKEKTLWKDAPWRNGTSRTRYLPGP